MESGNWKRLIEAIDGGDGMTAVVDSDFVIRALTPMAAAELRIPAARVVGRSVAEIVHPDDLERGIEAFGNVVKFEGLRPPAPYRLGSGPGNYRAYDVSGESFPEFGDAIALRLSPIDERGRSENLAAGQLEVLEMLAAGESVERCLLRLCSLCEHYVENSSVLIHRLSDTGISSISGTLVDAAISQRLGGHSPGNDPPNFAEARRRGLAYFEQDLTTLPHWQPVSVALVEQGWQSCVTAPAYDAMDRCVGFVEVLRTSAERPDNAELSMHGLLARMVGVVVDRHSFENHLAQAANEDALTGLGNRRALSASLDKQSEKGAMFGVLAVDLDQFSWINNNLGHMVGDALLLAVAQRFEASLPMGCSLFRHGGDEFMVIVQGEGRVEKLVEIAQGMLASLTDPIAVGQTTRLVQASIGIARHHERGDSVDDVLARADAAMYTAKREGGSGVRVFSRSLAAKVQRRMTIADALRSALEDGQFHLAYQPLFATSDFSLVGAEALARWDHPTLGILSPNEFIPIAEETSFVRDLDEWVMRTGQLQLETWNAARLPDEAIEVWVNLSPQTLEAADLADLLASVTGSSHDRLGLELTERQGFENLARAGATISELRERGFGVAIDDFGTGRASLQHLAELDVTGLKIDRAFIAQMQVSDRYRIMVETVVLMGHRLGLTVTAEGVEAPEHLAGVRELGCDRVQGYMMSRPVTPQLFERFFDPGHGPTQNGHTLAIMGG